MRKGIVTNRTIARDMMNMLRPDSILNRNKEERQSKATQRAKEWRVKNSKKAKEIATIGGNKTFELGLGIHSETFEVRSQRAKKSYKDGKGMAKLTREERSKIGKTIGRKNLVSEIVCENCGKKVNKGNYAQFHSIKCREEKIINLINLLPEKFTKSIVKKIAEENKIKGWENWNIFHELCSYTKCIIKVERPNQFNPCWYGKNKREINKVKKFIDDKKRNSKNR